MPSGRGLRGSASAGIPPSAPSRAARVHSASVGKRYFLPVLADSQDALAWHSGNARAKAHPAAAKAADALGLYDMLGNVAEWVSGTDSGGKPMVRGGSWNDPPNFVGPTARARQTPAWNETDPQFPKSRWWLADAPFVGFRIVREP